MAGDAQVTTADGGSASPPTSDDVQAELRGETSPAAAHGGMKVGMGALALGALGVVYGDIGTSPLYAFKESFEHHDLTVNEANALGMASIAFWVLIIIISIKYLLLVMRADNHGEGGILALTALVIPKRGHAKGLAAFIISLGVFGTALLYGDGLITPAISVLSAVDGVKQVTSALDRLIVPLACVILLGLFVVQRRGTGAVGKVFGPIMTVWFLTLAVLGIRQIAHVPSVVRAINPIYAVHLFQNQPLKAFLALGSIFLVVTGGEALYADMGHFGRRPIQLSWYFLVLPCLVLNYFGQAALLSREPEAIENPFFNMAPHVLLIPLVVLATMASVIASQALISGAFSLTVQAVQLDYLPRVAIRHTSREHAGQVYVPLVNWALMVGSIGLVIAFRTPSNLAGAYGIAVTCTMAVTTLLFAVVARTKWQWSMLKTLLVVTPLMIVDLAFLSANVVKIPDGGWFPLLIGAGLMIQMATWRRGRQLVADRIHRGERPIDEVLDEAGAVTKVPGTAVFMFKDLGKAPPALVNNLRHNKVIHRNTLLVAVHTSEVPRIDGQRWHVTRIEPGVHQVVLEFGFMEDPDVPAALADLQFRGLNFDPDDCTYFIGRETVLAGKVPGMNPLREQLFVLLNRGADSASRFFNLPSERVFEVGSHVEI
jgi:KUP system potassium uptake protein